jgi:hypothetical protein
VHFNIVAHRILSLRWLVLVSMVSVRIKSRGMMTELMRWKRLNVMLWLWVKAKWVRILEDIRHQRLRMEAVHRRIRRLSSMYCALRCGHRQGRSQAA